MVKLNSVKFPITFLLLVSLTASFAQEIKPISKAEVLETALTSGNRLKIESANILAAQGDYRQSNALFLPKVTMSYTGITTTNPLQAFGSKLNQERLIASDFDPSMLNDPERIDNFATRVEIEQPLLNLDGFMQRKAARAGLEAARMKKERSKEFLWLEIEREYLMLQLAYKRIEVIDKVKEAAAENLRIAENNYKQGILQQADVLEVKVRLTEVENQLQYAQSELRNVSGNISILMNDPELPLLKPTDSLKENEILINPSSVPSDRADLKAMEYATSAYEQQYKSDRMSFLPRLNAFGSYEIYDNQLWQGDAKGYTLGASLQWNLFDGSKRFGKTQKSRANFEKAKLEFNQYRAESNLELQKARRMLSNAKNGLTLSRLAMEQSKESLRIRKNRYREGLERTSDLLISEATYAQKQLEYYNTVYQFNYALAYLEFLSKE